MKFRVIIIFVLLFSGIVPAAYAEGPDSIAVPVWSYTLRDRITAMDCSDDGRSSIAGTQSGKVWFFSPDGKVIWTFERPEKSVMAVSVSGDGEYSAAAFFDPLASSSDAGGEIVYFNRTGSFLWSYPTRSTVHRLAVSGNGSTVFGSGDSLIYSFDRDGELRGKYRASGTIWGIASADDGSIGAAGSLYPGPVSLYLATMPLCSGIFPTVPIMSRYRRTGELSRVQGILTCTCTTGTEHCSGSSTAARNFPALPSLLAESTVPRLPSIMSGISTAQAPCSGSTKSTGIRTTSRFRKMAIPS